MFSHTKLPAKNIRDLLKLVKFLDISLRFGVLCSYPEKLKNSFNFAQAVKLLPEHQQLLLLDNIKPNIINQDQCTTIYQALAVSNKIAFLQQYPDICQTLEENIIDDYRKVMEHANMSAEQLALFDHYFERSAGKSFSC